MKLKSKWIRYPGILTEIFNILEDTISKTFEVISIGKDFVNRNSVT